MYPLRIEHELLEAVEEGAAVTIHVLVLGVSETKVDIVMLKTFSSNSVSNNVVF